MIPKAFVTESPSIKNIYKMEYLRHEIYLKYKIIKI